MGEWRELARLRRFTLPYRTILLGTYVLTVVVDLTVAMEVGLILACVFFVYRTSTLFRIEPLPGGQAPAGVAAFELFGSLFFGAVGKVESLPERPPPGTRAVVLETHRMVLLDTSGLDALQHLHHALQGQGVQLMLATANEQPLSLIRRSGFGALLGPEHIVSCLEDAWSLLNEAESPGGAASGR